MIAWFAVIACLWVVHALMGLLQVVGITSVGLDPFASPFGVAYVVAVVASIVLIPILLIARRQGVLIASCALAVVSFAFDFVLFAASQASFQPWFAAMTAIAVLNFAVSAAAIRVGRRT